MVGSNHTKTNTGAPESTDDPIAELSEIMKFDSSAKPEEDLGIDLESELLGELGAMPQGHDAPPVTEEDTAGIADDFAAAMRDAFPEEAASHGMDEAGNPAVPPELESQLQALLAELGGNPDDAEADLGLEAEAPPALDVTANADGEPADAVNLPVFEGDPFVHGQMEEPEAPTYDVAPEEEALDLAPANEAVGDTDPDADFSDALSRAIHAFSTDAPAQPAGLHELSQPEQAGREAFDALQGPEFPQQATEPDDPVDPYDPVDPVEVAALEPSGPQPDAYMTRLTPIDMGSTPEPVVPFDQDDFHDHGAPEDFSAEAGNAGAEAVADDLEDWLAAPEVETTELPGMIEPVAEDLDIPEIGFEDEPEIRQDPYDLDDDFSVAFNQLEDFDPLPDEYSGSDARAAESSYGSDPRADADDSYSDFAGPALAAAAAGYGAARAGATAYDPSVDREPSSYGDDEADFSLESPDMAGDEFYAGVAAPEQMQEERGRRYGILVAAAVATVMIAGGIGYFALSGSEDGAGPALVQADSDPLKVRPEDPGGTTAPNADKAVYDRVAGLGEPEAPSQESLITTSEEPVDIEAATAQPRVVLPRSSDDSAQPATAAPKADDRILPEETAAADEGAEEFVAIEPRRVRTLIVRPDGTLVPREEEVSPATSEGLRTTTGSDALVAAAEPADVSGNAAVTASDAGGAVLPSTGVEPSAGEAATVPTPAPRSGSNSNATGAGTAAAPAAEPAATAEVPAAAEPAGNTQVASAPAATADVEYWVQVSSQPTRELAQASYTDIARRYGNIVSGRAVNIYPAEIEGRGTFYRVRVAGGSRSEANALCEELKSAGTGCFVSR